MGNYPIPEGVIYSRVVSVRLPIPTRHEDGDMGNRPLGSASYTLWDSDMNQGLKMVNVGA